LFLAKSNGWSLDLHGLVVGLIFANGVPSATRS
jgi:hypothetical protein